MKGFSNAEYHLSCGKASNFTIIVVTLKKMETLVFKILNFILDMTQSLKTNRPNPNSNILFKCAREECHYLCKSNYG